MVKRRGTLLLNLYGVPRRFADLSLCRHSGEGRNLQAIPGCETSVIVVCQLSTVDFQCDFDNFVSYFGAKKIENIS
jgi:hypothetical protein